MNRLHRDGAEAWPISHEAPNHSPILKKIIIASRRSREKGQVHLTPNQALYAQARLSAIRVAFQHAHSASVSHLGSAHLPEDLEHNLTGCGAKVWTIISEGGTTPEVLKEVMIESVHPDGYGIVNLYPEDAFHIAERLTQITMAFLHNNVWGGEDASQQ